MLTSSLFTSSLSHRLCAHLLFTPSLPRVQAGTEAVAVLVAAVVQDETQVTVRYTHDA